MRGAAAFGNLIGDLMGGTYGLGSYFGMVGNFLLGYIPYRLWRMLTSKEPGAWSPAMLARYLYVTLLASIACGVDGRLGAGHPGARALPRAGAPHIHQQFRPPRLFSVRCCCLYSINE